MLFRVFPVTIIIYTYSALSSLGYALPTTQPPPKEFNVTSQQNTGRFLVQMVRSADGSETMLEDEQQSREPVWFLKNFASNNNTKKKLRRGWRKKRRAHINRDSVYISEFPTNTRLYKLCNKLGFFLRFRDDGRIDGTRNQDDENTLLVFESHGSSIIRVKSITSQRYLAMNGKGIPSAQKHPIFFNSLFRLTQEENAWDTIASFKYYFDEKYDMLIGITKEATVKKPWKASPGQQATQFLPVQYRV